MEQIRIHQLKTNSRHFEVLTFLDREKERLFLEAWEQRGGERTRLAGVTDELPVRGQLPTDPEENPAYLMALASIRYQILMYAYN